MVVLDGDPPARREPLDGELGRQVLRVEVVDDDLRLQREQAGEVGEAVGEGAMRRQVLEVAVVGRDVRPPAARERERVLELGADGQQRHRRRDRERHRVGGVAARPADDRLASGDDAGHGVVVARPDLPVVDEEAVGEPGEPRERVLVVGRQRLVGQVAGGQDDRAADRLEQEVVERRVGQEHAQAPVAGGHGGRDARVGRPGVPRAGRSVVRAGEDRPLQGAEPAQGGGRTRVADHHRERLRPAPLAVAEAADRRIVGGVAGEVVAAESLDRDDVAREERADRGLERRLLRARRAPGLRPVARRGAARRRGRRRARHGSGGRPGRDTRLAGRAQREGAHRRLRPVVRAARR